MDLTCIGGSVSNQFGVYGEVDQVGGGVWNYSSVHLVWLSSTTVPTSKSSGATSMPLSVSVSLTPLLPGGGGFWLVSALRSEVWAACGTPPGGYANSELQISSATLQSVVIAEWVERKPGEEAHADTMSETPLTSYLQGRQTGGSGRRKTRDLSRPGSRNAREYRLTGWRNVAGRLGKGFGRACVLTLQRPLLTSPRDAGSAPECGRSDTSATSTARRRL